MLQRKYLIFVFGLLFCLLFSCVFMYSGLSGEAISKQNIIIYLLVALVMLLGAIAIVCYFKKNIMLLLHISTVIAAAGVLYCSFFALLFCGEDYASAVSAYAILNLPEAFSAIVLVCLYFAGVKKLNNVDLSVDKRKVAAILILSLSIFLIGCLSMYLVCIEQPYYGNLTFSLRCKYNFLIAVIMAAVGFWQEVNGKFTKGKTIIMFVFYLFFAILIIFLPAITVSVASEATYDNSNLRAFMVSLYTYFYLTSLRYYTYELSGTVLVFVIAELLCFSAVYGTAIMFAFTKNETDINCVENDIENNLPENLTLEKRLEIILQLDSYRQDEIINDEEFNELKQQILNEENSGLILNDSDIKNLRKLKELLDSNILTYEEFERERKKIINLNVNT